MPPAAWRGGCMFYSSKRLVFAYLSPPKTLGQEPHSFLQTSSRKDHESTSRKQERLFPFPWDTAELTHIGPHPGAGPFMTTTSDHSAFSQSYDASRNQALSFLWLISISETILQESHLLWDQQQMVWRTYFIWCIQCRWPKQAERKRMLSSASLFP